MKIRIERFNYRNQDYEHMLTRSFHVLKLCRESVEWKMIRYLCNPKKGAALSPFSPIQTSWDKDGRGGIITQYSYSHPELGRVELNRLRFRILKGRTVTE